MFEDLAILIVAIQAEYDRICKLWDGEEISINLKKKLVIDARNNPDILNGILKYRSIINDEMVNIIFNIQGLNYKNSSVISRVKAQNSIEFKIDNYINNHENGKIPLKKCFNDLLGIRIVIDKEFEHDDVDKYMQYEFSEYKCIDSSKDDYIASHIYFEKTNKHFPWELQVWQKRHEKNNYASHKQYKQEYTKWEATNKGGVESD